jgi:hypothetical protein
LLLSAIQILDSERKRKETKLNGSFPVRITYLQVAVFINVVQKLSTIAPPRGTCFEILEKTTSLSVECDVEGVEMEISMK